MHDPIYTFVELPPHIAAIVDTPEFQRLRQIKQLSTVFYRYPGAHHTRFEHCIGTFHIASTFLDFLKFQIEERFATAFKEIRAPEIGFKTRAEVETAALLHDIGHGPFGHTMDFLLSRIGFDPLKRHEYFGIKKVSSQESNIRDKLISQDLDVQNICNLIEGKPPIRVDDRELSPDEMLYYSFLGQIVDSPISSDRIDYLIRDAYYSGVRMVSLDLTGILAALRLHAYYPHPGEPAVQIDLAFDIEAMWALEAALLSHTAMYKTVYHNRTHRVLQEMVVRAFESYIQKKYGSIEKISEDDVYDIMNLADHEAIGYLQEYEESREIIRRVMERRPYETALEIPWNRMPEPLKRYSERLGGARQRVRDLETLFVKQCGHLSAGELIIDIPVVRYPSMVIPLVQKRENGSFVSTSLLAESDIVKALAKIPFIDKIIVAVSKSDAIPAVRAVARDIFHLE